MISLPATLVAMPLVLIVWALDGLLFLCVLRRWLGPQQLGPTLVSWTDRVPDVVGRAAQRLIGQPLPPWAAWLIGILSLLTIRQALVAVALSIY